MLESIMEFRIIIIIGSDEISSIQHQLQHLKINPYPECKVIPDDASGGPLMGPVDPSVAAAVHPPEGGGFPIEGAQSFYAATSSDAQSMTFNSCSSNTIEQQDAGNTYVPHHQFPPVQQQQHSRASYPTGDMTHQSNQQQQQHYISREPSSLSSSSSYSSSSCCEEGINASAMGQQEAYRAYQQQQQQQQQPEMANMALQFMQAIQQSVNQVANVPDFGMEWVKPDYQFDPLVDDDFMDVLTRANKTPSMAQPSYSISSLEDPSSPESKSSGSSCGSSCNDFNTSIVSLPLEQVATVENVTLTQKTMEELYEALEEYSELYNSH